MRQTCLNQVYELARRDPRVFFVGSDLGVGTLKAFKEEMPERFLMEGVSEANLIGVAAGLALEGKIPYVNTIATFLTRRCFEQIAIDLCMHKANVRLIGNGGGVVYAPLGPTHEAVEDLAILRALPGMTILAPADAEEMKRLMPATLDHPGPLYIRLAKGGDPVVSRSDGPFVIGRSITIREGSDALLVTTGITLQIALKAAEQLAERSVRAAVLHMPTVKPFDEEGLLNQARRVRVVVTIEEHSRIGGIGSAAAETLAEAGLQPAPRFRRIALPDEFPDRYGSQNSLMERYSITPESVVSTVTLLLN